MKETIVGGKQEEWHKQVAETDNVPMVDSGEGKPYILRTFEFSINPVVAADMKAKKIKIDKQQLFQSHWPQIRTMLWGDGLVANEDVPPRIQVGKVNYRIFVLCEPKFGVIVNDKINTLQEMFKKKQKTT